MTAYLPVIVWTISIIICHYIAKARGATPNLFWRLFAIFFGPFAIPFVFLIRPDTPEKIAKTPD